MVDMVEIGIDMVDQRKRQEICKRDLPKKLEVNRLRSKSREMPPLLPRTHGEEILGASLFCLNKLSQPKFNLLFVRCH